MGPPPSITGVYPNPVLPGDEGEFVVLDVPPDTELGAYELTDGEDTIGLPPRTVSGPIAIAANRTPAERGGYPVVTVSSFPRLANGGETVSLRRVEDGRVVDTITFPRTREGVLQTPGGPVPLGHRVHATVTANATAVTAFALPDDPEPVYRALAAATDRILLAGYTLTDDRVVSALVDAQARGVDVRIVVEGSPVGGVRPAQVDALDDLADAGVTVSVMGGPYDVMGFHHAKYAVVDDTAVVLTENWKASGIGGHRNRGYGVMVHDAAVATELAAIFHGDVAWQGTRDWAVARGSAGRQPSAPAEDGFPSRFEHETHDADSVTLAVAPDNAGPVVDRFVASANSSLRVQQVRIDHPELERGLIEAAERGVEVEVLLSSAWYVRDENERLARCLNTYAANADVPLTVGLVEPRSRFGRLHAKLAIADGDRVLLGSLNWNEHAVTRNREVVVVVEGRDVAAVYASVFRADRRGGAWRLPLELAAFALATVAGVSWFLWREIEFDPDVRMDTATVWVDETTDAVAGGDYVGTVEGGETDGPQWR